MWSRISRTLTVNKYRQRQFYFDGDVSRLLHNSAWGRREYFTARSILQITALEVD